MINFEDMQDNENTIESLIKRTAEYGKTSFYLAKLKALDKTSDIVSSFVPAAIVLFFILSFLFFISVGLALWLGEILVNTYYGFFVVAALYGFTGIFIRLFMYKWIKNLVCNNIINKALK